MALYQYTALDPGGQKVKGKIEAASEFEAALQIKQNYPVIDRIAPAKQGGAASIRWTEPMWVADKTLSVTSSQFAIMLRAGLPVARVVELIAQQSGDKLMKRILTDVAAQVNAGFSLARSFEQYDSKLPRAFIETVRAGEESGTLETSFERLRVYYSKTSELRRKVKSAMTYPIILILLSIVVVGIVMVVLVPTMMEMFANMGTELPLITRILLAVSNFFKKAWLFLIAGVVALMLGIRLYGKRPEGRRKLDQLKLKLPILGKVNRLKAAAQYCNTMATLLSAGLSITRALSITGSVMDNTAIGYSVAQASGQVEDGRSLGSVLGGNRYLPEMLVEMATVGESAGALEDTLQTVGEFYDKETEAASAKALSMMEPLITIFLGVFIGFIVLAIYIPMFSMYGGVA